MLPWSSLRASDRPQPVRASVNVCNLGALDQLRLFACARLAAVNLLERLAACVRLSPSTCYGVCLCVCASGRPRPGTALACACGHPRPVRESASVACFLLSSILMLKHLPNGQG